MCPPREPTILELFQRQTHDRSPSQRAILRFAQPLSPPLLNIKHDPPRLTARSFPLSFPWRIPRGPRPKRIPARVGIHLAPGFETRLFLLLLLLLLRRLGDIQHADPYARRKAAAETKVFPQDEHLELVVPQVARGRCVRLVVVRAFLVVLVLVLVAALPVLGFFPYAPRTLFSALTHLECRLLLDCARTTRRFLGGGGGGGGMAPIHRRIRGGYQRVRDIMHPIPLGRLVVGFASVVVPRVSRRSRMSTSGHS